MSDSYSKKKDADNFGKFAEAKSKEYLEREGYVVREINWRPISMSCEIDLIAQKGDVIIFVEVKARNGHFTSPVDAVDNKKMKQMVKGADSYLGTLDHRLYYRFDIIAITGTEKSFTLKHIPDAFISPVS